MCGAALQAIVLIAALLATSGCRQMPEPESNLAANLHEIGPLLRWSPPDQVLDTEGEFPGERLLPSVIPGRFDVREQRFVTAADFERRLAAVLVESGGSDLLRVTARAGAEVDALLYEVRWTIEPWDSSAGTQGEILGESDATYRAVDVTFDGAPLFVPYHEDMDVPPMPAQQDAPVMRILPEGTLLLWHPSLAEWSETALLYEGQSITIDAAHLDAEHRSVLPVGDGVLILSTRHRCDWSDPQQPAQAFTHHRIDYFDGSDVSMVSEGPGAAAALPLTNAGALIQRGQSVSLWRADTASFDGAIILPSALVLHIPLADRICGPY
jgi:hypothetical protein